jgi:hypothetical protein
MMAGKFREYNWRDIQRLIFADAGLTTEEEQRTRGEFWHVGGFSPPEHDRDTCVRVQVHDKPFSERIKDHAGE